MSDKAKKVNELYLKQIEVKRDKIGDYINTRLNTVINGRQVVASGRFCMFNGSLRIMSCTQPLEMVEDDFKDRELITKLRAERKLEKILNGEEVGYISCQIATALILGREANGWQLWEDALGTPIDYYRNPGDYGILDETEEYPGTDIEVFKKCTEIDEDEPIDYVIDFIKSTKEYGKPSEPLKEIYCHRLSSHIAKLNENSLLTYRVKLLSVENDLGIEFTGGFDFYDGLITGKHCSREDVMRYIDNYEYVQDRKKKLNEINKMYTLEEYQADSEQEASKTADKTSPTAIEKDGVHGKVVNDNNKRKEVTMEKQEQANKKSLSDDEIVIEALKILRKQANVCVELSDGTLNKLGELLESKKEPEKVVEEGTNYSWGAEKVQSSYSTLVGITVREMQMTAMIKKAVIVSGVPGTGKTLMANALAHKIANGEPDRMVSIAFGKGMSYNNFIGGLQYRNNEYVYVDGILTKLCKKADKDRGNTYALVIDEISRGDTESIMGEMITAMECRNSVITTANGRTLSIPDNLVIIGTMNISDKSTTALDRATFERFAHIKVTPQWNKRYVEYILEHVKGLDDRKEASDMLMSLVDNMKSINKSITRAVGKGYMIGTRALSSSIKSSLDIKMAVRDVLIPTILERKSMMDMDKEAFEELMDSIKRGCSL